MVNLKITIMLTIIYLATNNLFIIILYLWFIKPQLVYSLLILPYIINLAIKILSIANFVIVSLDIINLTMVSLIRFKLG